MILSNFDEILTAPNYLLLDSKSFYQESKLGGYFIPMDVLIILDEVKHIFNILELRDVKKKWSLFKKKPPLEGELGEVVVVPVTSWGGIISEKRSPLFYLDKVSDDSVLQFVGYNHRIPFPSSSRDLFMLVDSYSASFHPEENRPFDIRKSYHTRMFSGKGNSSFLEKFNF